MGDIDVDWLTQERRNSSAWALELRLSCTNLLMWSQWLLKVFCQSLLILTGGPADHQHVVSVTRTSRVMWTPTMFRLFQQPVTMILHCNYIPRIRRIGGCYGFTSKPPAARRLPPAARNCVNAITQKPRDGLFSNLVYTLVVIVSWPD